MFCFVEVFEGAAGTCSFATFTWFLFWAIENLLELIVSLTLLAFWEVVLIWKLLQENFASSRFLVTSFSKFIKLSIIFYTISSLRNRFCLVGTYPNNRLTSSNEHSQFFFGGYEVVECHDDLKAECFGVFSNVC